MHARVGRPFGVKCRVPTPVSLKMLAIEISNAEQWNRDKYFEKVCAVHTGARYAARYEKPRTTRSFIIVDTFPHYFSILTVIR